MAAGAAVKGGIEVAVAPRELGRLRVVVNRAHVAQRVLPAIVGDHRPRAIEGVRPVVQVVQEPSTDRGIDVVEAEALVGDHPGHDRRMVAVASHQLAPFGRQAALGLQ